MSNMSEIESQLKSPLEPELQPERPVIKPVPDPAPIQSPLSPLPDCPMTDPAKDAASVIDLLIRYSFDLSGYTVDRLVEYWQQRYPVGWIRLAVIEALYQGRYKVVSVEQILSLWNKRGKVSHHFSPDFERIITPRFAKGKLLQPELIVIAPAIEESEVSEPLEALPSQESAPRPMPPRLPGAIQPFAVDDRPLPREAMFCEAEDFEPLEPLAPLAPELLEIERLEPESLEPEPEPEPEPVYFPEAPTVEFRSDGAAGDQPIPTFQPSGDSQLPQVQVFDEEEGGRGFEHQPIHQFVPTPEPSGFFAKLKAIVQNSALSKLTRRSGSSSSDSSDSDSH
jgi:hypothetical protein